MFICADAKCAIEPKRIAFEWNLYNKASYPSVSVFGDQPDSYWVGQRERKAGFVIDLGYEATVTEIHLRNANYDFSPKNM